QHLLFAAGKRTGLLPEALFETWKQREYLVDLGVKMVPRPGRKSTHFQVFFDRHVVEQLPPFRHLCVPKIRFCKACFLRGPADTEIVVLIAGRSTRTGGGNG